MQDFLLLMLLPAVFAFGWFLMRKLDMVLEENRKARTDQVKEGRNILRIGFSDPFVADSVFSALEQYFIQYSDVSVRLFYGGVEDLLEKVSVHKLDIIFLPEQADIPLDKSYNREKVALVRTPVMMMYKDLPIEPVMGGSITQNAVWVEESGVPAARCLMKYMKAG